MNERELAVKAAREGGLEVGYDDYMNRGWYIHVEGNGVGTGAWYLNKDATISNGIIDDNLSFWESEASARVFITAYLF